MGLTFAGAAAPLSAATLEPIVIPSSPDWAPVTLKPRFTLDAHDKLLDAFIRVRQGRTLVGQGKPVKVRPGRYTVT